MLKQKTWIPTMMLFCIVLSATGQVSSAEKVIQADETKERSSVPENINAEFLKPDLDPDEWTKRFEIESREVFAGREGILKALDLKPGQQIADVGSGTGLYVGPFAKAVGDQGKVYAIDISPKLIEHIERRIKGDGLTNVKTVQSNEKSIVLAEPILDRVFICDTYHHFEYHVAMLSSIHAAMKPGAELILVDFDRVPGKSREWLLTHVRAGKSEVQKEITDAGFEFVEEVVIPEFKENYLLKFRKPFPSGSGR
jgi:ubiquinone/menaquinone biosynthesis C-methylase UbiE